MLVLVHPVVLLELPDDPSSDDPAFADNPARDMGSKKKIYIYTHTQVNIYIYIHVCLHIQTGVCVYVYIYK